MRRKPPAPKKANPLPLTLLAAAPSVLALGYLFVAGGSVIIRFVLAIAVLMLSGSAIARANGIKDSYGAYLLGGKKE